MRNYNHDRQATVAVLVLPRPTGWEKLAGSNIIRKIFRLGIVLLLLALAAYARAGAVKTTGAYGPKLDTATFAAGCFWCVEAQFKELDGVVKVVSGFTGGTVPNPSYELVCTGSTGHAEACNIVFDPAKISYDELLKAFFTAHDPTQLNRQGADEGTQYRSAIFYHNATQKQLAEYYIKRLNEEHAYDNKVVTQVAAAGPFYKAEDYHQDYYAKNPNQGYCQYVIGPKLEKFEKVFKDKLKH